MKYEQAAEIAKIYNQIQASRQRMRTLHNAVDLMNLHLIELETYEEAKVLIKYHTDKAQRLREELTNATIG